MIDVSQLQWEDHPLLPAVVQDAGTGRILMLAYMNREALERTLASGRVTFFSRSRQRLWEKGETSGHTLELVSVSPDCDGDALLVRAHPRGPACHRGTVSCFDAGEGALETLGELVRVIGRRAAGPASGSYTRSLLEGGLDSQAVKLLEEAEELVRAARREGPERVAEEAADLVYHLLVLLQGQGVGLDRVSGILRARRR